MQIWFRWSILQAITQPLRKDAAIKGFCREADLGTIGLFEDLSSSILVYTKICKRVYIGNINSFPSTHPDWKILLFSNVPILKATSFFQNLAKSSNQFHQNTIHALKGGWLVEIFLLLHQSRKCKYDSSKAFNFVMVSPVLDAKQAYPVGDNNCYATSTTNHWYRPKFFDFLSLLSSPVTVPNSFFEILKYFARRHGWAIASVTQTQVHHVHRTYVQYLRAPSSHQ